MIKLLYNNTFLVDVTIESVWKDWIKNEYIPKTISSQGFESYKFLKILSKEEQYGVSYALQFTVRSLDDLINYQSATEKQLLSIIQTKWGEACLNFATVMEIYQEG